MAGLAGLFERAHRKTIAGLQDQVFNATIQNIFTAFVV
jgi:hypothetical protein